MPRRPTVARKTKYAEQLTGTALTLDQFTNKLMYGGKRHLAHRILEDALAREHARVRDGPRDVVGQETPVEPDRGVHLGGFGGEAFSESTAACGHAGDIPRGSDRS